ncbi:MAG TPA: hypothetical protein VHP34_11480 [Alphaproteobacteria bacterium]|nr:hypothetical protein [Alphaproteobacteria bacterium]
MSTLLSLLTGPNTLVAGILAVLAAVAAAWFKGRSSGVRSERDKQTSRDAAAMTEAQKIDEAVAGNTPEANRSELSKWSKS